MRTTTEKLLLLFVISVSLTIGGCQTQMTKENIGTAIGGAVGAVLGNKVADDNKALWTVTAAVAVGYLGRQIGRYLDEQDRARMAQATAQAASTGQSRAWVNPENNTRGQARVVATETKPKPITVRLKKKITQVPPLDIIGETYRARSVSNIRGGPGTDYEKLGTLAAAQIVNVVGQVKSKDWYLISQDGIGSGFVHEKLLEPAPMLVAQSSGESIAGGAVSEHVIAAERTCRTIEQSISLADGDSHSETIEACQGANGWEVVKS